MKMRIKYEREDIEAIIKKMHLEEFGTAPEGKVWNMSNIYCDITFELDDVEEMEIETQKKEAAK
jgi:hypothetical protein